MKYRSPIHSSVVGLVVGGVLLAASGCQRPTARHVQAQRVPVVYGTDLFHPHDDPDDHFDLACMYALQGIDLQAIILDQGARQQERPGLIPIGQMNHLTGRHVPAYPGLADPLQSPDDTGVSQDAAYQAGVEAILAHLEASPAPVTLVMVGSVRDLMAAYNRRPDLLRRKVGRVYAFIGEASDPAFREYNVGLDVHAYVALMRSDLPVWWVPCFDGGLWQNQGRASFWRASHADLLAQADPAVVNFFIYAMSKSAADPIAFLTAKPAEAARAEVLGMTRNLWCAAVFLSMVDRAVVRAGSGYCVVERSRLLGRPPLYEFEPVRVVVSDTGVVTQVVSGGRPIRRFRVLDAEHYGPGMTWATARLLAGLRP